MVGRHWTSSQEGPVLQSVCVPEPTCDLQRPRRSEVREELASDRAIWTWGEPRLAEHRAKCPMDRQPLKESDCQGWARGGSHTAPAPVCPEKREAGLPPGSHNPTQQRTDESVRVAHRGGCPVLCEKPGVHITLTLSCHAS